MFFKNNVLNKIIVALSGLFLAIFLIIHLILNFLTVLDETGQLYNNACNFMESNILIKIIEPILILGIIIHILYTTYLTYKSKKVRDVSYKVSIKTKVSWASQNMWTLGFIILGFLILHFFNYSYYFKFTDIFEKGEITQYELVVSLFKNWIYVVIYVLSFIALGFHLSHAISSGLQTISLSNKRLEKFLKVLSIVYSIIISSGFGFIAIYHYIKHLINS